MSKCHVLGLDYNNNSSLGGTCGQGEMRIIKKNSPLNHLFPTRLHDVRLFWVQRNSPTIKWKLGQTNQQTKIHKTKINISKSINTKVEIYKIKEALKVNYTQHLVLPSGFRSRTWLGGTGEQRQLKVSSRWLKFDRVTPRWRLLDYFLYSGLIRLVHLD